MAVPIMLALQDEFLRKQAEGEEIDAEQQQLEVASALMKLEHDMQEKYNVTSASVFLSQQAYADDEEVRMENERVREIFGIPDQHDLSSEPLPEGMTADLVRRAQTTLGSAPLADF
jgi:hypothetical protein